MGSQIGLPNMSTEAEVTATPINENSVIAVGNILSRGLGLVRDVVIASTFGATGGTDAYVFARTIPTLTRVWVAGYL